MSLSRSAPRAVICIPSFRRPQGLEKTLRSLEGQQADFPFAVVAVDNDAVGRAGLAVAERFFSASGVAGAHNEKMTGRALVESSQGNCHAINAAFSAARQAYPAADYLLMIDDDETAGPHWLAQMVATARKFNADIVGGPVARVFAQAPPRGVALHPLYGSLQAATGPVRQIHGSGNCLIARRVFERLESPQFDPRFNFLGGGDMEFFSRARRAGLRFAWCAEAVVTEFVPESRMTRRFIMTRSLRTGIINYSIDRRRYQGAAGWLVLAAKNAVSLGLSPARAVAALLRARRLLPATHPFLMAAGRIAAGFGVTLSPYKANG